MTSILSYHIDQATELLREDGEGLEHHLCLQKVFEAAKAYDQLTEGRQPVIPINEFIERQEDMGRGRFQLLREEDGDMCVTVINHEGQSATVQFCTRFGGGGRSPKVLEALYALAAVIMEENEKSPLPAQERL